MGTIHDSEPRRPVGKIVFNGTAYYKPRKPNPGSLRTIPSEDDEEEIGKYRITKPNRYKLVDKQRKRRNCSQKTRAYAI